MKKLATTTFCTTLLILHIIAQPGPSPELYITLELNVGQKIGTLRSVPVSLGNQGKGILLFYSADKEIDPWIEMFYPPTDRVKMIMTDLQGNVIWKKTMDKGLINGVWFCPVYPFDMDKDGVDEIYYVNQTDSIHILSYNGYRLEALNGQTGERMGQWNWHRGPGWDASLSHLHRNFILGGYVKGEPVLVTAQGTYAEMSLQAWNAGMKPRWQRDITREEPGARGSHMTPVVDINMDGIDEIMWGERCISIRNGAYHFIADEAVYNGHSDVIQPTFHESENRWYIFTCRESGDKGQIKPRVVMFDDQGERVWSALDEGHMDMGWTATVGANDETLAFTISRGAKIAGPDGFYRADVMEFAFEGYTGNPVELPFKAYNTIPVDLDGDGIHEFASALGEQSDKNIYMVDGTIIANLGQRALISMASKFLDLPGEQIMTYYPDGTVKVWAMRNVEDGEKAFGRYQNPYYKACQRLTAVGYNLVNLGGL